MESWIYFNIVGIWIWVFILQWQLTNIKKDIKTLYDNYRRWS